MAVNDVLLKAGHLKKKKSFCFRKRLEWVNNDWILIFGWTINLSSPTISVYMIWAHAVLTYYIIEEQRSQQLASILFNICQSLY